MPRSRRTHKGANTTDHPDHHDPAPPKTEADTTWTSTSPDWLQHPLTKIVLALVVGVAIFLFGRQIGGSLYEAFDGDGGAAAIYVTALVVGVVAVIGIGVGLDRWLVARCR